MEQIRPFGDERQLAWCVYCGGANETRDHVPARVFLDDPLPENLPVVPACWPCNQRHSLDEEYVACLVECVLCGSVGPARVTRPKVARILGTRTGLAARLALAKQERNGETLFSVEDERVRSVVLKFARGHAAFELHEPRFEEPAGVAAVPLHRAGPDHRVAFERVPQSSVWPEVGSRAMIRMARTWPEPTGWIEVQPQRYRYTAMAAGEGTVVRVVLSEYLACEVTWNS